jgi:hypothetical protein
MTLAAVLTVTWLSVGACTGDAGPTVASAQGQPSASPSGPVDAASAEMPFVACMRTEGIDDMPDPVAGDTSGRSAVRYAIDVMGKGSDETFQAALDECMRLLPPGEPPEPPTSDDRDAYQRFAQCMRDNGVPEFPDFDPNGSPSFLFYSGDGQSGEPVERVMKVGDTFAFNAGDPLIAAALETCQVLLPPND